RSSNAIASQGTMARLVGSAALASNVRFRPKADISERASDSLSSCRGEPQLAFPALHQAQSRWRRVALTGPRRSLCQDLSSTVPRLPAFPLHYPTRTTPSLPFLQRMT